MTSIIEKLINAYDQQITNARNDNEKKVLENKKYAEIIKILILTRYDNKAINFLNKLNNEQHDKKYDEPAISHWLKNDRPVPLHIRPYLDKQINFYLMPWGYIELNHQNYPEYMLIILDAFNSEKPRWKAILENLKYLNTNFTKDNALRWSLIGITSRIIAYEEYNVSIKYLEASEKAFSEAENFAQQVNDRELSFTYQTNKLNAQREIYVLKYKHGSINKQEYESQLLKIYSEQKGILKSINKNKVLALKHCLRLSSLLNDENEFKKNFKDLKKYLGQLRNDLINNYEIAINYEIAVSIFLLDSDGDYNNAKNYKSVQDLLEKCPKIQELLIDGGLI